MAYEIRIIGEQNPILLANEKGLKVIEMYESPAIAKDAKVNLGDLLRTTKGQIRSIKRVEDSVAGNKKINQSQQNLERENMDIYKSWVIKTPEQRSHRLELFKQCYKAIHDQFPSPEVVQALQTDLITFFRENPKRTYGDPNLYIKHFGEGVRNKVISKYKTVLLNLLERVIGTDMQMARFS